MKSDSDACVVIVTHNEQATIGSLLGALSKLPVIVVDDGTDKTADIAVTCGADVTYWSRRMGIGYCLRRGLDQAVREGYKWVVVMDAGGTHFPYMVYRLLETARGTDADVVIASRFAVERPASFYGPRGWLSLLAALMYRRIGVPAKDVTTSFRCYKASMLQKVLKKNLVGEAFETQPELLTYMVREGACIVEIPASYVLTTSSFKLKFIWLGFKMWWRLLGSGG